MQKINHETIACFAGTAETDRRKEKRERKGGGRKGPKTKLAKRAREREMATEEVWT